jgi:ABC-type transport system involved in multi-copper enzyme maturation permease subunit
VRALREQPWDLWRRQALAVIRLEVRKSFWGRRALLLYLLALLPLGPLSLLLLAAALGGLPRQLQELGPTTIFAAAVYAGFILSFSMYLGCVWIFMNLFRGEVLDRSLHFYFLAPIRRPVLVVTKFLSGWIAAAVLYGGVTALSFLIVHLAFGVAQARQHLVAGPGLGQLLGYLGVTALGCLGYGAVFLVIGLFFRNPIVPALVIWGWEAMHYLLPPVLKRVSVVHYLYSLSPVPVAEGPFAILTEPTPAWVAVPGLLAVAVAALAIACWRIRRTEIEYASD